MKQFIIVSCLFCFFSVFAITEAEFKERWGVDYSRLPESLPCSALHADCTGKAHLAAIDDTENGVYYFSDCVHANWHKAGSDVCYNDGYRVSDPATYNILCKHGHWGPPSCPYLKGCTKCTNCNQGCLACNPDYHSEKNCSSCGALYRECTGHYCKTGDCPNGPDCYPCDECGEACAWHNEPYKHFLTWCSDCNSEYFNCVDHNCPNGCPNLPDCNQCSECNKCTIHNGGGFDHTERSCAICFKAFFDCVGHNCSPVGCPDLSDCKSCSNCGVCVTHKSGGFSHSQMTCVKCEQTFWDCAFHPCIDDPDDPDSGITDDGGGDDDDGGDYKFPVDTSALDIIKSKLLPNFTVSVGSGLPNMSHTFTIFGQTFTVGYDFSTGIVADWLLTTAAVIKIIGQFLMTVIFIFACIRIFKKG